MPIKAPQQAGSSLLEVMIALFVLAIGLLGFVSLQTEGMSLGRQAYMHSQAAFLAQDMLERIAANTDEAKALAYQTNYGDAPNAPNDCGKQGVNCNSQQLAVWDRKNWLENVAAALPGGLGAVDVEAGVGTSSVTISIQYRLALGKLNPGEAEPSDEAKTYTYVMETEI